MELTESVTEWAAKQPYFNENSVKADHIPMARRYALSYAGDFKFMKDMHEKVAGGTLLSSRMIAAILNCARKEGLAEAGTVIYNEPEVPGLELEQPPTASEELQEIYDEIQEMHKAIIKFKTEDPVEKFKSLIEESNKEEQELYEQFTKKIQKMRDERVKWNQEMHSFTSNIAALQDKLDALKANYANQLKIHAAQQELDANRLIIEEMRAGKPWSDSIFPFQWEDVIYIVSAFMAGQPGVLLANDMGLGKTMEAAATDSLLYHIFQDKHERVPSVLWLTKKSLMKTTFNEIKKWNPDRQIVMLTSTDKTVRENMAEFAFSMNALIIANYESMQSTDFIRNAEWDIVYMDEVHKLKGGANHTPTLVWQNARDICKRAKFIVPLSGSPIQNHPREMWSYLHIFNPVRFPDPRRFEREFCFGYGEFDDDGNPIITVSWDRLIESALKGRVIRRSKAEVLLDLPDKTREFRYVEMGVKQREVYDQLRTSFFIWLDNQKSKSLSATAILAQLTRLRQLALWPAGITITDESTGQKFTLDVQESAKIDEAMDIVTELVEAGEQVIVTSSQFNSPLFEVARRVELELKVACEVLTGDNSSMGAEIQDRFQQGITRVLCVNAKTGGEGYNLQKNEAYWPGGANHMVMLDLWWNPKSNEQMEDRIHRQGQKDAVTIHIIQAESSVDAFIAEKIEMKEEMISGIMERSELRSGEDWKSYLSGLL